MRCYKCGQGLRPKLNPFFMPTKHHGPICITDVPMEVCEECGVATISHQIAKRIDSLKDDIDAYMRQPPVVIKMYA